MEKNHCYDLYQDVLFHVRGKNLSPFKVNGLLRAYRLKLGNFSYEDDRFFVSADRVDEFNSELVQPNLLICSQQIKWHIWAGGSYAGAYPGEVLPILHKAMLEQKLDNGKKYSKKIYIEMVNTHFKGDSKTGRWPAESLIRIRM